MKVLFHNQMQQYELLLDETTDDYVLSVLCGRVGMSSIEVKLTSEQVQRCQEQGHAILDVYARQIREKEDRTRLDVSLMQPIPRQWLVKKLKPAHSLKYQAAAACFAGKMQEGDEIWEYDEPAPDGVNAGELGLALVRAGEPIDSAIQGIH